MGVVVAVPWQSGMAMDHCLLGYINHTKREHLLEQMEKEVMRYSQSPILYAEVAFRQAEGLWVCD